MAFSFSNVASSGSAVGAPGVTVKDGAELQEIQTNELGFAALNGESRVRLLPTPWPTDDLPPPSSSLLSVASVRGLLAAAGPDAVYITSTTKVREAFQSPAPEKSQTRQFQPEIKLPYPRVSHVVFSCDESVLVVSTTGGIVAFQVESLQKGNFTPALEISTNNQNLRMIAPNPVVESAELFAVITANGDLMLLDLKAGGIKSGSEGDVLTRGASCLSWSNRGKQLVAGMSDGTAIQMKPDGTVVANIPKSTSIPADSHVSGISWLENDTFFIIYTPNQAGDEIPPSEYYIVQRTKTNYTFQKLPEVLPPFGLARLPAFHFISRLRNFPPLQDLLIVTATTATDVGLISKSDQALSQEDPVVSAFTFTTIEDDTRRAQLPLSATMEDTSPIGMVVDLSSSEKVPNPIPSDPEIEETAGPVPCLLILNNEGILVGWWVINNESVRSKTTFSGLSSVQAAKEGATPAAPTPSPPPAATAASTAGGPRAAGTFGQDTSGGFGTPAAPSPFGAPSAKPFGTSSPITSDKPSWANTGFGSTSGAASTPAFGQPAFGSATPMGGANAPAFGSASALGSRTSAFGQPSAIGGTPAFGQTSGFGTASTSSPFAKAGGDSTSSGFASFSKGGGFASFAGGATGQGSQSPFGAASGTSPFAQTSGNTFSSKKPQESPFASKKADNAFNSFGSANAFKLQSSFQGDGTAKDDLPPPKELGGFSFGSSFGDILNDTKPALSPTHNKEEEMDEESEASEAESDTIQGTSPERYPPQTSANPPQTSVTPPSTLMQPKTTPVPAVSTLFGPPQNDSTTPLAQNTTPGWSFDGLSSTTPKETPKPSHMAMFGTKPTTQETPAAVQKSVPAPTFGSVEPPPDIKKEPANEDESVDLKSIPEAPLPPDTVSKPRYASGETSASSNTSKTPPDDAPLPPDFLPVPKASQVEDANPELPDDDEDDFSSGFEDEEEEEVEDESPEEQTEHLETSPESSFKSGDRSPETSPTGGLFTKVTSASIAPKPARPLFGEVGTAPVFAPPKPQESPRSPSPVRQAFSIEGLRADASRSVSAPAHPRSVIDQRKAEYQKSGLAAQAARTREEEAAKEKARREAIAREKAQAEAEELAPLEDDEDERLRQELERPITPSETLDDFVTYQPRAPEETQKTGIPAQIERLYSDINSMVYTLGINCRSLSAFLQYQQPEATNQSWPAVLKSETPVDALNDELLLTDIARLHEGYAVLSDMLADCRIGEYIEKSEEAQALMKREVFDLRNKLMSVRKTLHSLSAADGAVSAPLSAEQTSIQHDLRKSFTCVQTQIVQIEDGLSVLRAKLAQLAPADGSGQTTGALGRGSSRKKPTVEAVKKTVEKMMSMAEQKSADIDVLEAQLKKMGLSSGTSLISNGDISSGAPSTPPLGRQTRSPTTPGSAGSVYHTPDSKFGSSTRPARGFRTSQNGGLTMISAEDKQRWQAKARRRKDVANMLKEVLEEKQKGFAKVVKG
ncbi:uncharacterized protein Z520_07104 [Fonsecaea multimorphosa CBS 102226]|uniref:Nucleoporin Nup159/Nup146 N-terminal domain-containing protein n=1 Tax=Fonsecaea multimorphosa CBS 102226 TaxID=1442371 RepID=A0A0D2H584_9EURO|nr:uncharacterized protein Z520_07104 [Fonsecaea multimorphosa CBS 102226]KIX96990.1 hypothetical protein Z520_07104 [Fonsecaea multimorphosa CBS 102226]OAL23066.1 hypothetical protein AYO22_06681 [Fonsecaea multimorphosa]